MTVTPAVLAARHRTPPPPRTAAPDPLAVFETAVLGARDLESRHRAVLRTLIAAARAAAGSSPAQAQVRITRRVISRRSRTRMSDLHRAIRTLEARGWLARQEMPGPTGSIYHLLNPREPRCSYDRRLTNAD